MQSLRKLVQIVSRQIKVMKMFIRSRERRGFVRCTNKAYLIFFYYFIYKDFFHLKSRVTDREGVKGQRWWGGSSFHGFTSQIAITFGAGPNRSRELLLSVPYRCKVPRTWSSTTASPKPLAGSWIGYGAVVIRTSTNMGFWCHRKRFNMLHHGARSPQTRF